MANFLHVFLFVSVGLALGQVDSDYLSKISPQLRESLELEQGKLQTVLVTVQVDPPKKEMKANILARHRAQGKSSLSSEERGQAISSLQASLQSIHLDSESSVLSFLQAEKANGRNHIKVEPLWITNKIIVSSADGDLIHSLAKLQSVQSVEHDQIFKFDDTVVSRSSVKGPNDEVQWGVTAVDAPAVWDKGNTGANVLVGVIDTGVRVSHESLKNNYANNNFSWFDPSTNTSEPTDEQGHGTHCTGSIVGTSQGIGVAKGASWMACRGCSSQGCSSADLLKCGEFMACPTTADGESKDCSKAPHIVSNSWGGPNPLGLSTFYDDVIDTWRSAGIIPVFALGNSGRTGCSSTGYPGDSEDVIAIGASANDSTIADFSSLGPTKGRFFFFGKRIKPDFSAPGKDIYSAGHQKDDEYVTMSGTSMATPHAAGIIALMLSDTMAKRGEKGLSYDEVREALIGGSTKTKSHNRLIRNCGGKSENQYPNNHAGYGILNASKAIESIKPAPTF